MAASGLAFSLASGSSSTPMKLQPIADCGPHQRRVLADPRGEDERIEPSERGGHRGDRAGDALVKTSRASRASGELGCLELLDSPGDPREAEQAGLVFERVLELCEPEPAGAQEVQHDLRVDRAGAGAIGTPSSGLKPIVVSTERPSQHGRDRAAAAEMADDEPWHRDLRGRPLHGEAVEAVAADAPFLAPALRHCVDDASSGIVAWKAVSKTATCGTPGSARRACSIAASAGRCGAARAREARPARRSPRRRSATARGSADRRARRGGRRRRHRAGRPRSPRPESTSRPRRRRRA